MEKLNSNIKYYINVKQNKKDYAGGKFPTVSMELISVTEEDHKIITKDNYVYILCSDLNLPELTLLDHILYMHTYRTIPQGADFSVYFCKEKNELSFVCHNSHKNYSEIIFIDKNLIIRE